MRWLSLRYLGSFLLSTLTALSLTIDAYDAGLHTARFTVSLVALLVLHTLGWRKVVISREALLYLALLAYTTLTLLWTPGLKLGLIIVQLSANFALILLL